MSIYSTSSSGTPGTSLYVLDNPQPLNVGSTFNTPVKNTFTAPTNAKLSASTHYFVVFEETAGGTNRFNIRMTTSVNEDSGRASGWKIDDLQYNENLTAGTGWAKEARSPPWIHRITIQGTALAPPPPPDTTPPRVRGTPAVTGDTLTLSFNERLRSGAVPSATAFSVLAGDAAPVHPTAVALAGRDVRLTLAKSVAHGETVEVRYTRPADGGRLRDAAGNAVADFTRTVTNNTPAGQPVADAGADLAVDPGAAVTLDGSGSADPDGDSLTWAWTQVAGAPVGLTGADTAVLSFTVADQAGPLTFRLTVTDPDGLVAIDTVTVTVRDLAPRFDGALAALALDLNRAADVVLPAATGGNGALTYSLASDPAGLAGLTFDPVARTLAGTPAAVGNWTFTYRAEDADGNRAGAHAAELRFTVTVDDARTAQVRQQVRRTLAGVARRSLSSALDNIGARFAASVPAGGLTLAGHAVPLGGTAGAGLTDMADTGAERFCSPGSPGSPASPDGFGADLEGCAVVTRGMTAEELLHASAFSLTLGAAGGSGTTGAPASPQWSVWARGDLGTFAGRPEPGMGYEGELRTGWLGVDARAGGWVAGLALSHGTGEADYDFAEEGVSGEGRLETSLTALYPYGRWTLSEGLELRGVLGAGSGEARHRLDGDAGEGNERSDLSMWMGSVGLRREFPSLGGFDLAARADASLARMETGDGPEHIAGLTADSWRLRAGLEASRRIALDGDAALEPFVEAAARRDGGDGLEGTGLEIAGGVRYTAPRLHLEMRGRWLASHSEEDAEERGVSVTARMGPGARGRGLSLSLSPRWGAGTGGAEALWRDELPGPAGSGGAASMDARIGYGFSWAPYGLDGWSGLLTPFAETGFSGQSGGDSRRLRLGARFEASRMNLGVELAGERREGGTNGPEHALRLDLGWRF